jgi:NhaA family Na+:H+ antiporter
VLWVCVLKSGVHATLAGVIIAFTIPNRSASGETTTVLRSLEHGLHPWVAFGVLPLFAFANAGVSLKDVGLYNFADPVQLGIFFGLFVGKPIGIFGVMRLMIGRGIIAMPEGANWLMLLGMSCLCGIGFTMSLFIGGLAWEHADFAAQIRLGVITGSIASATLGLILLLRATGGARADPRE